MKATGHYLWGPGPSNGLSPFYATSFVMNNTNSSIASVLMVPKDGSLKKIGLNVLGVYGDARVWKAGFVTVDGDGFPTTNLYGGCAIGGGELSATGWLWITLGTGATAAQGDLIAARFWPYGTPYAAPDGDNYISVSRFALNPQNSLPRMACYTTSWTSYPGYCGVAAMYSDGTICLPAVKSIGQTINSDSTPDQSGARFQVPFLCTCAGVRLAIQPDTIGADFDLYLENQSGTLAQTSIAIASVVAQTGLSYLNIYWDDPITLTPETYYRLSAVGMTTDDLIVFSVGLNEAASRAYWPDGELWSLCYRTDGGAWTDDSTGLPMMQLILSEITFSGEYAAGMLIG